MNDITPTKLSAFLEGLLFHVPADPSVRAIPLDVAFIILKPKVLPRSISSITAGGSSRSRRGASAFGLNIGYRAVSSDIRNQCHTLSLHDVLGISIGAPTLPPLRSTIAAASLPAGSPQRGRRPPRPRRPPAVRSQKGALRRARSQSPRRRMMKTSRGWRRWWMKN